MFFQMNYFWDLFFFGMDVVGIYIFFDFFLWLMILQFHEQMPTKIANPHILIQLAFLFLTLTTMTTSLKGFGMNKPHYLFHLGDRRPVSTNLGWGYWADSQKLRMKYANTNQDIYANMVIHDGQNFFQQHVQDRKSMINSRIRYQVNGDMWEAEIEMENGGANLTTWFTYFSIQNNDYKLIDHEKHTSYIYIVPNYIDKVQRDSVEIKQFSYLFPNQTLTVSQSKQEDIVVDGDEGDNDSDNQIKFFGITANISETYSVNQISETFKHLVRVSRGEEQMEEEDPSEKNKTRGQKSEKSRILQWQRRQLGLIKQDKWDNKTYVVFFTYGTVKKGQKTRIYLTNSTKPGKNIFDHELFQQRSKQLSQQFTKNIKQSQKIPFVKHVISNLYGGIAFYFGRLYTQNSLTVHKQDYSYSFTPSRLIFPRSFLWDDGFHQSVIVHYNPDIVLDVLTNWMNKIDIFGWIGREQIRGGQISSMMPDSRFVFQDWFQMNPPTLMLSLISLIEKSHKDPQLSKKLQLFLNNYYRKLQMWYRYFKNTQSHQSLQYQDNLNNTDRFFRWHCKDQCSKGNFMGSGLDDYPRRGQQTQIAKQHVDLVSWLYLFSSSLVHVGEHIQKLTQKQLQQVRIKTGNDRIINKYTRRVKYYKKQAQNYIHKLYDSFFDESDNLFKDVVVTKSDLFIEKFVDKIGYINLFPFFTGMLAEGTNKKTEEFIKYDEKRLRSLKKCLQIMGDENLLLSQDGLRSLSFSDPLYGTDDNYWRGAVWLPINYMVLRACKLYYWNDSTLGQEVRALYQILRERLIDSVEGTYKDTGYLFENYYKGRGHRGFPFYGWTSTIVNIITEQY